MRGKVNLPIIMQVLRRITPAYAGKSGSADFRLQNIKDHPRLCGEKMSMRSARRKTNGSPPPMRGKD